MNIQDFTVTERPGERTKAKSDGLRINMTREYAALLAQRLIAQLADESQSEVDVAMFGEIA